MPWEQFALEIIRIVISWPVAAVIVAVLFQSEIRGLIARVRSVSMPGMQIQAPQMPERPPVAAPPNPPPPELPAGLVLTPAQQQQFVQIFQAERAAARLWEYRYLNQFLARGTQIVLDWLIGLQQSTTIDAFEAYWIPVITDAAQRRIIIDVLQAHNLIQIDGPAIRVTDKGREYAQWRGPLPPLPPAPAHI